MPYFICPNCKDRSIDHDRMEGLTREAVACHRCGFGFLFELLEDYYPAPNTGLIACDAQTSGGLLAAVSPADAERLGWPVVGELGGGAPGTVLVD